MLKIESVNEYGFKVNNTSRKQMKVHIFYEEKLLASIDVFVNEGSHVDISFDGKLKMQKEI